MYFNRLRKHSKLCIEVQFSEMKWIHITINPSNRDGPTQGADLVIIASVTQVPILTQTTFY